MKAPLKWNIPVDHREVILKFDELSPETLENIIEDIARMNSKDARLPMLKDKWDSLTSD